MSAPPRYFPAGSLPAAPYRPGRGPRPAAAVPAVADARWGVDLYNAGCFWEAHEAWEALWRAAGEAEERSLLQGLILAAAACLKLAMGREASFKALALRAAVRLRAAGQPAWIDAGALAEAFARFAAQTSPDPDGRPRIWLARPTSS